MHKKILISFLLLLLLLFSLLLLKQQAVAEIDRDDKNLKAIVTKKNKSLAANNRGIIENEIPKPQQRNSFIELIQTKSKRGEIPSNLLLVLSVFFLIGTYFALEIPKKETPLIATTVKYGSRMFFITILYYFLKNVDSWLFNSLEYINFPSYKELTNILIQHFRSSNYDYFLVYVVDIYWLSCLFFCFPCLYFRDKNQSTKEDKYISVIKGFFSVVGLNREKKICWTQKSQLGLLTLAVKLFFIPYMTSWTINNLIHQKNQIASFQFDFHFINNFLVSLLILADVAIFSFGYLVESKTLKNEIKSVEPTVLGWVVCLWCYPPFNGFSFWIFSFQLVDISHNYPNWIETIFTCLITFLWGIYVWSSISLGFKASNLTNRGVVSSGPYRFIRHPAYTSKVFLWIIQGIFFGTYWIGHMIGFTLIYALRAWTEERHLSMDKDYLFYKKKVKYAFIPRIL